MGLFTKKPLVIRTYLYQSALLHRLTRVLKSLDGGSVAFLTTKIVFPIIWQIGAPFKTAVSGEHSGSVIECLTQD